MTGCDFDVVLYFYDEMEAADRLRATVHLRECAACRQRLEELEAIRRALGSRPTVEGPAEGDWSAFMRRLDQAVSRQAAAPARPARVSLRYALALAATLAIVTFGVSTAVRHRTAVPQDAAVVARAPEPAPAPADAAAPPDRSLREVSAEHLERSKLVVLGLATRDPQRTSADDWQYERRLAGALLSDTRLYRLAAQDRGVSDVAHVMRDLETVLLEASLSDVHDKAALARVQRLIAKRDLVVKMQVVAGAAGL